MKIKPKYIFQYNFLEMIFNLKIIKQTSIISTMSVITFMESGDFFAFLGRLYHFTLTTKQISECR